MYNNSIRPSANARTSERVKDMEENNNGKNTTKNGLLRRIGGIVLMLLIDIAVESLAFYLARTIMFFRIEAAVPNGYAQHELAIAICSVCVLVCMLVIFDCYNSIWKYAGRVEFLKFLLAYLATFVVLLVAKLILQYMVEIEVWIPIIIMFLLISALISGAVRFFSMIVNYIKHVGRLIADKAMPGVKRTIVIGAGYTGALIVNRFINNQHEGYYPVAILDDDPEKHGKRVYGISVEGGVDDIEKVVKRHGVDTFVIAIMSATKSQLRRIYKACAPFNVPIKVMGTVQNADEVSNSVKSLRDIKIEELLGRDEFTVRQELMDVSVKDKVVMVTGGAGSIGSELCRQALNFGCKHLVIFDMHENGMFFLNQEFAQKYDTSRYTLVMGTVREKVKVQEPLEKYKPDI